MIVHASDLTAYARCPAAYGYRRAGLPARTNSGAAYGGVIHFVLEAVERQRAEGVPFEEAVESAVASFLHYWHPLNIEAIAEPVPADGWLPGRSYGELRVRGVETIRGYADLIRFDATEMLALEYGFIVPIENTWDEDLGEPHLLAGTVDQLAVARHLRREAVAVRDHKSQVREPRYLRHHMQFSAYCYATTRPEFWTGWRGEDGFGEERGTQLYERFRTAGRRATWIDLHRLKFIDAGWRGPIDYARFALAVEGFVAAVKADIYPLSISGETCPWCDFRATCGGGLPDSTHGDPSKT